MSFVAFAQTFLGSSIATRALEALDPNAQQNLGSWLVGDKYLVT